MSDGIAKMHERIDDVKTDLLSTLSEYGLIINDDGMFENACYHLISGKDVSFNCVNKNNDKVIVSTKNDNASLSIWVNKYQFFIMRQL